MNMVLLLDYYGDFLTAHQKDIMERYYGQDLSLQEIALLQTPPVSRQSVLDTLRRAEQVLCGMEQKLHVAHICQKARDDVDAITAWLERAETLAENDEAKALCAKARVRLKEGFARLE